ncbi:MAG: efflux RND transporter permease subunit [Deltaproteobacteria bacterium]|nr:efflux RND transporter permease subunit [Deltaproteobacteria bacterium]
MKSLLAALAANRVFANLMLFMILLAGIFGASSMIIESMPEMSLDMINVSVFYPGADPEEVEEAISRKIEETIKGMEGIDKFTTNSSEGSASVSIEVKTGYDVDELMEKVKTKVQSIMTFPVDAERPIVNKFEFKRSVMTLFVQADMSERRLKAWSEQIKDEIQNLPEVSTVSLFGAREYEINIGVSEERLREYGITINQVASAISMNNMNMSGGTIRTEGEEIRIRTLGRKYTGAELSKIVVLAKPGGEIITLDRIAEINDGFNEDPINNKVDGKRAVLIRVSNSLEEDAIATAEAVKRYVAQKQSALPEGATIKVLEDATDEVRARLSLLESNAIIGLLIVFVLLWAFMNIRIAFWCGLGIPIAVAGGMMILPAFGGTINMMTTFAFILILGIVVDDAIVVGEAIYVQRQNGVPMLKAAVEGTYEVTLPVIAAVLTTVIAFLPLAFVGGVIGKIIFFLPVVVTGCLLMSLLECLALLPAHLNNLPDPNEASKKAHPPKTKFGRTLRKLNSIQEYTARGMDRFVEKLYMPFLKRALAWRYISFATAVAVLIITLGLVMGGIIKYTMFPSIDGDSLTASVRFPNGTPQDLTQQAVDRLEESLNKIEARTKTLSGEPLVRHTITLVGQSLGGGGGSGPNVGSVQALLLPSEDRGIHSNDLSVEWEKETGSIPGVESLTFGGGGFGPGGAPIEVWIQGYDMDMILQASDELIERLREFEGVYQVKTDFTPGKNELRLKLKPEAQTFGLTVNDLGRQIFSAYFGNEALRIQRGRDDIRVKIRYTEEERTRLSDFERLRIRTTQGNEVPLLSVADISYGPGFATITRTDGMRRVEVNAQVDSKQSNAREIMSELQASYFPSLKAKYPGLNISVEGHQARDAESFGALFLTYPMALLGIFFVMAVMFRSYIQPFVIFFTIPFGIIGAIVGHMILGVDLAIMSAFGIVALTGVVVNSAIVLIDRVNKNLAEGMSLFEAVESGSARRFRAIFLTTVSTVGALLPLILEKDMQAQMLIPMAVSIAAGVLFSSALTLVLIPSLLIIMNDVRLLFFRLWHGYWPTREEVEPASKRDYGLENEKGTLTGVPAELTHLES